MPMRQILEGQIIENSLVIYSQVPRLEFFSLHTTHSHVPVTEKQLWDPVLWTLRNVLAYDNLIPGIQIHGSYITYDPSQKFHNYKNQKFYSKQLMKYIYEEHCSTTVEKISLKRSTYFFHFSFYFILLCNTVLVLPYTDMNPPWVYMCSLS